MTTISRYFLCVVSLVISAAFLMPACGYRFAGGGTLPGDVTSVSIEVLKNRTALTGFEITFTSDITYEFNRAQAVEVTTPEKAQAILSGAIQRILVETLARTGTVTVSQKRATLSVDLTLTGADKTVLWQRKGFTDYEDFDVGATRQETDENQRIAMQQLSRRMAENIYKDLTANF